MDESPVQPALCVLGHPIAGNPAQFCIARALAALDLDWQCLSFDVPPASLPAALTGIDVLRFLGALVEAPFQSEISRRLAASQAASAPSPPQWIDGLARDDHGAWVGCNFLAEAVMSLIRSHRQATGQQLDVCLVLGDEASFAAVMAPLGGQLPPTRLWLSPQGVVGWPAPNLASTQPSHAQSDPPGVTTAGGSKVDSAVAPETARVPSTVAADEPINQATDQGVPQVDPAETSHGQVADDNDRLRQPLLLIHPPQPTTTTTKPDPQRAAIDALAVELLQGLHGESLQLALPAVSSPWPARRSMAGAPSGASTPTDIEIRRLASAIRRWTGQQPSLDLLAEAIEEYLDI